MTKETIYETVVKVIRQKRQEDDLPVTPETSLRDDLGVDSIDLMEFVIALEDEFGIDIPDEDVDHMVNMNDLLTYLEKKVDK
ncbi:acyl carrier protein [Streptococcus thoraltensis]|uniref:acyl carrier protein n=1 Tax=Streptococcus thoraltensis TaxID=55085 RepID=UPI00036CCA51|nr:acyl carrier protein [Streptococcus thoraltensis]MDY4761299.1 acyl carrier protein [Streptococcus thoraltensis]